jgi:hypothetical protein
MARIKLRNWFNQEFSIDPVDIRTVTQTCIPATDFFGREVATHTILTCYDGAKIRVHTKADEVERLLEEHRR